jgi:hypothetical protein
MFMLWQVTFEFIKQSLTCARLEGTWVLLQNVHLLSSTKIRQLLQESDIVNVTQSRARGRGVSKRSSVDNASVPRKLIAPDFRLILTAPQSAKLQVLHNLYLNWAFQFLLRCAQTSECSVLYLPFNSKRCFEIDKCSIPSDHDDGILEDGCECQFINVLMAKLSSIMAFGKVSTRY